MAHSNDVTSAIQDIVNGMSQRDAADKNGMSRSTLQYHYEKQRDAGNLPVSNADAAVPSEPVADPVKQAREKRDVSFWQKRAQDLANQVANAEDLKSMVCRIAKGDVPVPDWVGNMAQNDKNGTTVPMLVTSDFQFGEVVDPDEIDGLNAYNPAIAQTRYQTLIDSSVVMARRYVAEAKCPGMIYLRLGDTINGDIHAELRETNSLTSAQQCREVAGMEIAGLLRLRDEFGKVLVVSVPGNHGRSTIKPIAKKYALDSYDTLVAWMIEDRLAHEPGFTFLTPDSGEQFLTVLGVNFFITHGDRMGSGGGQGFIGASAPITRGAKKTRDVQAGRNRRVDFVVHGHFHTSMRLQGVIANGSLVGFNEFANKIKASPDVPRQWLLTINSRWGLQDAKDIALEPPRSLFTDDVGALGAKSAETILES